MSIAEQILQLKSDFDNVRETSRAAERKAFWNNLQNSGNRTDYSYAFFKWTADEIFPYYPINADSVMYMFLDCVNVTDLSQLVINITSDAPNLMYIFANCLLMKSAPRIVFSNADVSVVKNYISAYANCINLTSASVWWGDGTQNPVGVRNSCQNMFFKCEALTDIEFTGQGSPLSLDLSYCTKLTRTSVISLYNSLMNVSAATAGVYKITLHPDTLALLTSEEIQDFTSKGWILEEKNNENN